MFSAMLNVFVM